MKTRFKRRLLSIICAPLAAVSISSQACSTGDSVYIGTVCATAANFCPQGYAVANGALQSISSNPALFSLIGANFGGDGRTTFALPDLRGRSAVGIGQGSGLSVVTLGQKRGLEQVTQTVATLAPHTHTAVATAGNVEVSVSASQTSGVNSPEAGYLLGAGGSGPGSANIYVAPANAGTTVVLGGVSATTTAAAVQVGNTGNGSSTNNLPPQLGLTYCIATQGVFPPRP